MGFNSGFKGLIYQFLRQQAADTPLQHLCFTLTTAPRPHTGADHTLFTAVMYSPIRLLPTLAYRALF